jgi:hypothetical protein
MSEPSSHRTWCTNLQTGRLHVELTGGPAGRPTRQHREGPFDNRALTRLMGGFDGQLAVRGEGAEPDVLSRRESARVIKILDPIPAVGPS